MWQICYNFEANVSRLVTIFYISLLFAYFVKFDDRITVMLLMWMNSTGGVPSPCWGGSPAPNGEVQSTSGSLSRVKEKELKCF